MELEVIELNPTTLKTPPTDDFGFGNKFANRMFSQKYSADEGWHDAKIVLMKTLACPRQRPFSITRKKFLKGLKHTAAPTAILIFFGRGKT